ncbi:hypothetical protein PFISCL1PPCAC_15578, partial [Pristionchus fissidentatus]
FSLVLFLPISSSSMCNSPQCHQTSQYLFSTINNQVDACTNTYEHICTSKEMKDWENEKREKIEIRQKNDHLKAKAIMEKMIKNGSNSMWKGIKKLNESCVNFNDSLINSMTDFIEWRLLNDSIEAATADSSRGKSIFFTISPKFGTYLVENQDHPIIILRRAQERQNWESYRDKLPNKKDIVMKFFQERKEYAKHLTIDLIMRLYDVGWLFFIEFAMFKFIK